MWATQVPIALCTESQAVQTPLTLYSTPAGTQTVANKGLNIPKQDIPNISLEPNNTLLLIAKLSS